MMTITDAEDVQLVLERLHKLEPGGEPMDLDKLQAAIARLADRSTQVLGTSRRVSGFSREVRAGLRAGDFAGRKLR